MSAPDRGDPRYERMFSAKPTIPQIIAVVAISAPFVAGLLVLLGFSLIPLACDGIAILDIDPNRYVTTGEAARLK